MNFLDLSYNILWSIGIFSSSGSSKWNYWIFNIYRAILLVFLVIVMILLTVQLIVSPDLSLLARTIDIWTLFLSGTYKWLYMTLFSEEFGKLNWELIKIQAQGAVVYGKRSNQFTVNYLKQTKSITLWYLFSGIVTAALFMVNPLIVFPKRDRSELDYFNDSKSYPFSFWIPFVIKDYWMFYIFFACHSISALLIVLIYMGIDSFMFGAMYAIGGQIELLNASIKTIDNSIAANEKPICKERLTKFTEKQQKICYAMLRECSKHHAMIHNYIKQISTNFSSMIIVDYLHGIISLTFALFQLSNSTKSEFIVLMVFIFVSTFHQYLNNFFGEFIVQKQLSVSVTAYDVRWWQVDKNSRFLLTLMILRSNKPTLITGLYMYNLCYSSFISFVKALYSYYMVLRRVNIEQ